MKKYRFFYIVMILLLVAGCSSIEEIVTETQQVTASAFEAGPKGINIEKENFSYYMPDTLDEESIQEHNVILKEGKQTYILFVNTLEPKTSRVLYEATYSDQEYLLNETYENDKQFGFVKVLEVEDGLYEVVVGVGGVKLTTVTKENNVAESADKMMQIANSVRYKS